MADNCITKRGPLNEGYKKTTRRLYERNVGQL